MSLCLCLTTDQCHVALSLEGVLAWWKRSSTTRNAKGTLHEHLLSLSSAPRPTPIPTHRKTDTHLVGRLWQLLEEGLQQLAVHLLGAAQGVAQTRQLLRQHSSWE